MTDLIDDTKVKIALTSDLHAGMSHFLDERGELDYLIAYLFKLGVERNYGRGVIGIINKGAIRAPIKAGAVSEDNLFSVMPFRNTVGLSIVRRYELKELVRNDEKGDLIISGITQKELQLDSDDYKEYLVVLSNFLEDGLGTRWIRVRNLDHDQVEIIKTGAKLFKILPRVLESFV